MGFHIRPQEDVQSSIQRVASEQVQRAINDLSSPDIDRHLGVHQMRKRCKKLRGLLRLAQPHLTDVYASENQFFRNLSLELSFLRDAQALLEAYDRLLVRFQDESDPTELSPIRRRLLELRAEATGEAEHLEQRLDPIIRRLQAAVDRVAEWTITGNGFDALSDGMVKTYRRARRAMRVAYDQPSDEHFHEWRKGVKYHWHHARLLNPIAPRFMKPHRRLADELGELLGQDHDYAVLRQQLQSAPDQFGSRQAVDVFLRLAERRQEELRAAAQPLGQQLLVERPRKLAARWRAYWQMWRGVDARNTLGSV